MESLLVWIILLVRVGNGSIFVDYDTGNNLESCLVNSDKNYPCKTLDYALSSLSPNNSNSTIRVIVLPGNQPLEKSVSMSNSTNFIVCGENQEVRINCVGHNVGLKFVDVTNIQICNISFNGCGAQHDGTSVSIVNTTVQFRSALYFLNSTNVLIQSIAVTNSSGIGIALFDTSGNITIVKSIFSLNKISPEEQEHYAGGGGIHIEYAMCSPGILKPCNYEQNSHSKSSSITIAGCNFTDNEGTVLPNASASYVGNAGPVIQMLGTGGGISLLLGGSASNNTFTISGCNFYSNRAQIGGGMAVVVTDNAEDNVISISNTVLKNNTAVTGGGAVEAGFFNAKYTSNNTIQFYNTSFSDNKAEYGGGASFFSTRIPFKQSTNNMINFSECNWMGNSASIGAGVLFYPDDWSVSSEGYHLVPTFTNCNFIANYIAKTSQTIKKHLQIILGGGIVQSSGFNININKTVSISGSNGSAFLMFSGQILVKKDSTLNVTDNSAIRGAGIALMGYSGLMAFKNSTIILHNNHASDVGGGIYYNTADPFDFINSQHCFITYEYKMHPDEWKTNFIFSQNYAGNKYGSSIFATTLKPCARATRGNGTACASDVFHWKSFTFDSLSDIYVISTEPATIVVNTDGLSTAPGVKCNLNVTLLDDLKHSVNTVLMTKSSNVLENYHYITNDQISFEGLQNDNFSVAVQTINSRQIGIEFDVHLNECPPGYVLSHSSNTCICSVSTNLAIPGIIACNETDSKGILQVGYWAGCTDDGSLITGQCPLGYCTYKNQYNGLFTLVSNCSSLDSFLCSEHRTGVLCGECKENFSVQYHSSRFKCVECGPEKSRLGWLFYILSELLPLTVVFVFVILFDVSLTSGSANAFIFFAQILDFFQTTAFNSYSLPTTVDYLTEAYWFIFGFFNLDFFRLDYLSFCLKENANVLFILSVKYITTAFGVLLVILLFLLVHCSKCNIILQKFPGRNKGTYSITYGVTALIILSYSQCAKVSFQILTETELKKSMHDTASKKVMFLSGLQFFDDYHIKYAIPALFVVILLAFIPIFLIFNPLYYIFKNWTIERRMNCTHITCSDFVSAKLTKCNLLLKPILDAFQGCYKDNTRFFAGLYFLYRLLASAVFAFATTALTMYGILEALLLVVLVIHAIAQPYRKKFHNALDALIFGDLAIINGISLYNFASTQYMSDAEYFELLVSIQVALVYLPIFYMVFLIFLKFLSYFYCMRKRMRNLNEYISIFNPHQLENDHLREYSDIDNEAFQNENDLFDSTHLPDRMVREPHVRHSPRPRRHQRSSRMNNYGALRNERKTY